jgi:hypothetical protein
MILPGDGAYREAFKPDKKKSSIEINIKVVFRLPIRPCCNGYHNRVHQESEKFQSISHDSKVSTSSRP